MMSPREIYSLGLIAGLTVPAMRRMTPGFIVDMFIGRQRYDMALHGLKFKTE